ncbi:MAG: hypothetical protein ACQESH_00635 [Campylobacterota bacterium]
MATSIGHKNILADAAREDATSVINIFTFFIIIFSIVLFLILFVPKVYLANEIYYKSQDIQKLRVQVQSLEEEKIVLERKIESMKFQNSVIYTMF